MSSYFLGYILQLQGWKTRDHTGSDGMCHCAIAPVLSSVCTVLVCLLTVHLHIKQVKKDNCIHFSTELLNRDFTSIINSDCGWLLTCLKYFTFGKRFSPESLFERVSETDCFSLAFQQVSNRHRVIISLFLPSFEKKESERGSISGEREKRNNFVFASYFSS